MRIGVDASALVKSQPTGVEKATGDLIRALIGINSDHQLILYTQTPLPDSLIASPAVENRVVGPAKLWTQTALKNAANNDNLDLFWSPSNALPLFFKGKTLATIHDLAFVRFPQIYSTKERLFSNLTVWVARRKRSHIIAVSHSTKEDLMRYFKIPEEKISVIYNALSNSWKQKLQTAPSIEGGSYILFVSRIEERKNIENMLRAFEKVSGQFPNLKFILVGKQGAYAAKMKKLVKELNIENKVEFRGYVKSDELSPLFKNSKLILYPSLYEGFGIPILEGFAAHSPVVTSKFGATKEVASDAAVLVNPHNVGDIAHGISLLMTNPDLRADYIKKGSARLEDFSWEESAKKLLLTIEKI